MQVGANGADRIEVGGTATLSGGTVVASSIAGNPALGSVYPILAAAGGVSSSFDPLTEPTSGIAAGTRFDTQYGSNTVQFATYGQWQSGMFFAEAQLGLLYQQEHTHRTLPLFGAATQRDTDGLAGGGGVTAGMQKNLGAWLIEPSLGFSGFDLHLNGLAERAGGALAENIGGATLDSAESTLAVNAQRAFALSGTVQMTVKGRLGWSHEFADNMARISASFAGLRGSGFALASAPIGRDAALVGLGADIKVASWPVTMFAGYGGAVNVSSNAQSFNAGVRFVW